MPRWGWSRVLTPWGLAVAAWLGAVMAVTGVLGVWCAYGSERPPFEGEIAALPEDHGVATTYTYLRCPEVVGQPLNLMAYVRESPFVAGGVETIATCLHKATDYYSPQDDPRLHRFAQCWMTSPLNDQGQLDPAAWIGPQEFRPGEVLWPAGTGQIYTWRDARGRWRLWCDFSAHFPGF